MTLMKVMQLLYRYYFVAYFNRYFPNMDPAVIRYDTRYQEYTVSVLLVRCIIPVN